jgi:hypothetical protein
VQAVPFSEAEAEGEWAHDSAGDCSPASYVVAVLIGDPRRWPTIQNPNYGVQTMKYFFATIALLAMIGTASADSCWRHNGSLMRLEASGNDRTFTYEVPNPGMWGAGG